MRREDPPIFFLRVEYEVSLQALYWPRNVTLVILPRGFESAQGGEGHLCSRREGARVCDESE